MFKRLLFLFSVFIFVNIVHANTITLDWMNEDGTLSEETICNTGENVVLPTPPTKTGYTFIGWQLPKYIPLEYIENIPSDSYLDTGFKPNTYSKMVVDAKMTTYQNASQTCITAATAGVRGYLFGLNLIFSGYVGWCEFYFGQPSNRTDCGSAPGAKHVYSLSSEGLYIDEVKKLNAQNTLTASNQYNLFIFANDSTSPTSCTIRLYSLQLYQEDTLIHDYVPAMDLNGVVCFYDKVTDTFLYNQGLSDLIGGPILDHE